MKKNILLFFVFLNYCAFAQTEKGSVFMGVSSNLNVALSFLNQFDSKNDNVTFNLDLYPEVGFFVKKNLALGVYTPVSFFLDEHGKEISIGFNPFIKKYFGDRTVKPYIQEAIGFGYKGVVDMDYSYNYINLENSLDVGAGIFLSKKIELDLALCYNLIFYEIENPRMLIENKFLIKGGFVIHFNKTPIMPVDLTPNE